MKFRLDVFAGEPRMAQLGHDPLADAWTLDYAKDWREAANAYPLSPALPLDAA